ncbi:MAG: steroid 5-alpha reductase family enzyme [Myxococcota bacterium]|jgi:steroid 5-alpha reductase family enzyme
MSDRVRGLAWVGAAYVSALIAAAAVVALRGGDGGLLTAALADAAGTVVVFAFSRALNNTSVYDPYWSVAPIALVGWWAWVLPGDPLRTALVVGLVCLWGVRLTVNWASGWTGLDHEDWRYVDFRRFGVWYWPISLAGLHGFPTVQVFLGLLPAWVALQSTAPVGAGDWIAGAITLAAIGIEAVSDRQLHAFVRRGQGGICEDGLWRWSRHPNYFGEIGFWVGLGLLGTAAAPDQLWPWVGAGAIIAMFVGVSVPLLDRRSLARRPGYDLHVRKVSAIVPWFRRS